MLSRKLLPLCAAAAFSVLLADGIGHAKGIGGAPEAVRPANLMVMSIGSRPSRLPPVPSYIEGPRGHNASETRSPLLLEVRSPWMRSRGGGWFRNTNFDLSALGTGAENQGETSVQRSDQPRLGLSRRGDTSSRPCAGPSRSHPASRMLPSIVRLPQSSDLSEPDYKAPYPGDTDLREHGASSPKSGDQVMTTSRDSSSPAMRTQKLGAGSRSTLVEALQRTAAASALGTLVIATPAAAHNSGPLAEALQHTLAAATSIDPSTDATGKLPDDEARGPMFTQLQLAGCSFGHNSYEQFTCK